MRENEPKDSWNSERYEGSVYLIQCNGLTKIGYSKDPDKRIEILEKTKFPHGTKDLGKIEKIFEIITDSPRQLEKDLHELLDNERVVGEWFHLKDKDIKAIREIMLDTLKCDEKKYGERTIYSMPFREKPVKEDKPTIFRTSLMEFLDLRTPCKYRFKTLIPNTDHLDDIPILASRCQFLTDLNNTETLCEDRYRKRSEINCPTITGEKEPDKVTESLEYFPPNVSIYKSPRNTGK